MNHGHPKSHSMGDLSKLYGMWKKHLKVSGKKYSLTKKKTDVKFSIYSMLPKLISVRCKWQSLFDFQKR